MSTINIKPGKYQHHSGKFYQVIGIARRRKDLEELIVYKALYENEFGKDSLWLRTKEEFLEKIEIDGKMVPKFKFVG